MCDIQTDQINQVLAFYYSSYTAAYQVNQLLLLEQSVRQERMEYMNKFILASPVRKTEEASTIQIDPRREALARFRAKKLNFKKTILYQVRKVVADRRLRINGKFISKENEAEVLHAQKLLGTKIIQNKNQNITVKLMNRKTRSKEGILKAIQKISPEIILQRIIHGQKIFKIVV